MDVILLWAEMWVTMADRHCLYFPLLTPQKMEFAENFSQNVSYLCIFMFVVTDIHLLASTMFVPDIYSAVSLLWKRMNGKKQCCFISECLPRTFI